MPPAEPPLVQLDRLLKQGDAAGALRVADQMIAQSRRTFGAWLGRAVALMNLGQIAEADASVAEALKLSPGDAQAKLIQAMLDQRLGRIDRAVAALAPIAASKSPQAVEAGVTLAETLWYAHRRDELKALVAAGGVWLADPRARLSLARMKSREDPSGAITDLTDITARERNPVLRRIAGFDAVGLLDKAGRYREAFDLATKLHAESTPPFDLEGMLIPVREQAMQLAKG